MSIDLDHLVAIDTHVHVEIDAEGHRSLDDELLDASSAYFKQTANRTPAIDEIAEHYRERRLAAVVFTVDAHVATGHRAISSFEVIEGAGAHDDVLIPFASVDPNDGAAAVSLLGELIDAGAKGLKLHPSLQRFVPNDRAHYRLYALAEERSVPIVFHTGQTGIGAGLPGGRGVKLRLADPMLIDDVAADFPGLSVILAHPSVPWQQSAISMATHKSNVYIDLSGWSPRYFPAELVAAAGSRLRTKVLFGTDFPLITPDRWLADFDKLGLDEQARGLVLKHNAVRVLGL